MCIITISKIHTCWHLEPIFAVARCDHAISVLKRYCNRACCPPLLVATFTDTKCDICALEDRPSSPTQQQYQQQRWQARGETPNIYESPYIDIFRAFPPMLSCMREQPFDLGTLISSEWAGAIQNAYEQTQVLLAELLWAWFPMEVPGARQERARFEARLASHPYDMEVLEVRECMRNGVGVCVCDGSGRREGAVATVAGGGGGRRIGPGPAPGSARLAANTTAPDVHVPTEMSPLARMLPPPAVVARIPPQPQRHAPRRSRAAPYPPPPLPHYLREGGGMVPALAGMIQVGAPETFPLLNVDAGGVDELPPTPGSGRMVHGWVVTARWEDEEDEEDEEEEEELEEGEGEGEAVEGRDEAMMVDAVGRQGGGAAVAAEGPV
jgi:hypothetical protein